ncbi:endoribonuclease MazF [Candidatus Chloroploca sp. M-50]|uniref:Endoribonuclease MazF n=1 Tax=Candidatus Chloroploca mongolica TaxID=2528176 RepID=A0ABS4D4D1_9CHLR|nr:endoribonuclease MazF [Candidatus Chloroploca mongolica]MBP1464286.1 endoribonuclease MazF [Candidatus Chloroploca mongolica]
MTYIPSRGDIVWLTFNPQAGSEQAVRRPAIVLSPSTYNGKVGLAIFCPITNQVKGYPFEVALPKELPVTGIVLSDQVKSLDWRSRNAQFAGQVPTEVLNEVLQKVSALLFLPSS